MKKEHLKVALIAVFAVMVVRTIANRASTVPLVGPVSAMLANGL